MTGIMAVALLGVAKAAHLAAAVLFLSGLLLLTAVLRVVQRHPHPLNPQNRALLVAARQWDRRVATPALLVLWMLGLAMAVGLAALPAAWLQLKLLLVVGLSAWHGRQSATVSRLLQGNGHAAAPRAPGAAAGWAALATVLIAGLAVLKPFQ